MLRLVVALAAEARPLVARWELRRDPAHRAFRVFCDTDADAGVMLVVSGVGKAAAAAATAYLGAVGGDQVCAWIDVGVAGHRALPAGDVLLAHQVVDVAAGRAFYPPLVFTPPCATAAVHTVDVLETVFAADAAYDMEAAGYLAAASRFATAELAHCVKVVADGPADVGARLAAGAVEELIAAALPALEATATALRPLVAEVRRATARPEWAAEALARWRFTASDERRLDRLVRRWLALAPEADPPSADLAKARRGRDVNHALERWIATLPVRLGGAVVH